MRRRPIPRKGRERGAAAVEFGLIVVILLTLLIGIIQFSIWFWAYQVGAHAAREGARFAAVDPCNVSAMQTRVTERVGSAADGSVSAVPSYPDITKQVGDQVKIDVEFTTHDIGGFISLTPTISKSATARIENVPAGGGC